MDFSPDDFETVEVFYPSKDGTKIPLFLTYKKGLKKDGQNPTYLYGYGGFNIPMTPAFSPATIAWMEMGGIFAQASLRGGGEYGKAWHDAGTPRATSRTSSTTSSRAAEYLIREKYTSTPKLAIAGGSNGGLLVARLPDAAARPVRRGAARRRRARHAALPQVHDRLGVEVRLRRPGRRRRLRDADEVLAAAQPEARAPAIRRR